MHRSLLFGFTLLFAPEVVCGQTSPPAAPLDRQAGVHPYSTPGVQFSTDDGRWIFSAEGGAVAFIEFGTSGPGTADPASLRQAMPVETKRVPLGALGVLAADLVLDPEADLSDDGALGGPGPEDTRDLLYVAGGHLGLWAMEAHPGAFHANRAVRLDDAHTAGAPHGDSERFCTAVATARLGSLDVLLALFARADDNVLRVYDLDEARQAMTAASAGELGFEIEPLREVAFGAHPLEPADVIAVGRRVTRGRSFGIAMDVDRAAAVAGGPFAEPGVVDVHIAAMTSGVLRVRLAAGPRSRLDGRRRVRAAKRWGPLFGDGTPHATRVPGRQLNASGLPAFWYRNRVWRSTMRATTFGNVLRHDPPHVLDVAVQNDADGHYLYVAADHLGWLRFALDGAFGPELLIDHHEGIPSRPHPGAPGRPAGDRTRWLREVDLAPDGVVFEPTDLDGTPERNARFAHRVELSRVGEGAAERTALVVGYGGTPWSLGALVRGPGRQLDQTLAEIGGHDFEALELLDKGKVPAPNLDLSNPGGPPRPVGYAGVSVLGVYDDVAHLTALHVGQPSSVTPNLDRWIPVGVRSIHVLPREPHGGELLRVLHGAGFLGDFGTPVPDPRFPFATYSVGVSFFDLSPGADPDLRLPVWLRDEERLRGRYAYGAGFAAADPRVVVQTLNDTPIRADGLVWTEGPDAGGVRQLALPPGSDGDPRLQTGVVFDQDARWLEGASTEWVIGSADVLGAAGWTLAEHLFGTAPGSGAPTVDLVRSSLLGTPTDRYGALQRDYYLGGVTDPGYDLFSAARRPAGEPASRFAFLTRAVTPDGLQVVGREPLVAALPQSGAPLAFADPRLLAPGVNPWTSYSLNTHPEWDQVPFDPARPAPPGDPLRTYERGAQFWTSRLPLAENASTLTLPPDAARVPDAAGDGWILGVPAGFASCPPDLDALIAGPLAIDPAQPFGGPFDFLPVSPSFRPVTEWSDQFRRGTCILFDLRDPWRGAAEATSPVPPVPGMTGPRPPGTSSLDPLFLSRAGSCAFDLEFIELRDLNGGLHVLAFVADFSGAVEVFDVTDVLTNSAGPRHPIATWLAPPDVLEGLSPNVYDVELDAVSDERVDVYVAASRTGVHVTSFELAGGFTPPAESVRIKTAGEAHTCAIRRTESGSLLLVADLTGGYRFFGRR